MLHKGVYLLFTCRTHDELTKYSINKCGNISFDSELYIKKMDDDNIDLLRKYVLKYIPLKLNGINNELSKSKKDSIISTLIDKADYRLLHLKIIKELIQSNKNIDLCDLPSTDQLFNYYLEQLHQNYGEKFYNQIVQILCIISTAFENLTTNEISYLLGEHVISFKLIAYLLDLRGLLQIERSERGNVFSIAHGKIKYFINKRFLNNIKKLMRGWLYNLLVQTKIEYINDGDIYLHSYIIDYIKCYNMNLLIKIKDVDIIRMIAYTNNVKELDQYNKNRKIGILSFGLEIALIQNRLENYLLFISSVETKLFDKLIERRMMIDDKYLNEIKMNYKKYYCEEMHLFYRALYTTLYLRNQYNISRKIAEYIYKSNNNGYELLNLINIYKGHN